MPFARFFHCLAVSLMVVSLPLCSPTTLPAQQPDQSALQVPEDTAVVQEIRLVDGTRLLGRIVAIDGNRVRFETVGGLELEFQDRDVASVREARGVRRGKEFWREDPSNSRLFFAPTARVSGHGRGYFGVYELFFPSFGVGITNMAMVSGGVSLLPHLALDEQLYYLSGKIRVVNTRYVQGAVGTILVKPGTSGDNGGLVFTTVTAGELRGAVTAGLAFPFYSDGGFEDEPILILGGEMRATNTIKLITENWIVPGEDAAVLSLGIRIIAGRITVEAAGAGSTEGGIVPIVSFSVTW